VLRQSSVIRHTSAPCLYYVITPRVNPESLQPWRVYLNDNYGGEFCEAHRFVAADSARGEKSFPKEAGDSRRKERVPRCLSGKSVALLRSWGIEYASSFLMGFLCPTRGDSERCDGGRRNSASAELDVREMNLQRSRDR